MRYLFIMLILLISCTKTEVPETISIIDRPELEFFDWGENQGRVSISMLFRCGDCDSLRIKPVEYEYQLYRNDSLINSRQSNSALFHCRKECGTLITYYLKNDANKGTYIWKFKLLVPVNECTDSYTIDVEETFEI